MQVPLLVNKIYMWVHKLQILLGDPFKASVHSLGESIILVVIALCEIVMKALYPKGKNRPCFYIKL